MFCFSLDWGHFHAANITECGCGNRSDPLPQIPIFNPRYSDVISIIPFGGRFRKRRPRPNQNSVQLQASAPECFVFGNVSMCSDSCAVIDSCLVAHGRLDLSLLHHRLERALPNFSGVTSLDDFLTKHHSGVKIQCERETITDIRIGVV